jgi:hypothetical protein
LMDDMAACQHPAGATPGKAPSMQRGGVAAK